MITDLPPSHYHNAILVVVDRLTKQALFIPTAKSMAAPDIAVLSSSPWFGFTVFQRRSLAIGIQCSHRTFGGGC